MQINWVCCSVSRVICFCHVQQIYHNNLEYCRWVQTFLELRRHKKNNKISHRTIVIIRTDLFLRIIDPFPWVSVICIRRAGLDNIQKFLMLINVRSKHLESHLVWRVCPFMAWTPVLNLMKLHCWPQNCAGTFADRQMHYEPFSGLHVLGSVIVC
jgi:hypothetical protein